MSCVATHAPDVTDAFTTNLIRKTAQALVDEGTFPQSDQEDVIQDLTLALLEQTPNFNPERAKWSTWVKNVVRLIAISIRRRQDAECRRGQREVGSLNVLINDEDGQLVELGATVSEQEHRSGLGVGHVSHTDQNDTALDVQKILDGLPENLRDLAVRLKTQSLAEISRELNVPRTTLAHRVGKIREAFAAAGYGN